MDKPVDFLWKNLWITLWISYPQPVDNLWITLSTAVDKPVDNSPGTGRRVDPESHPEDAS